MHTKHLNNKLDTKPLKYALWDTPHATVEPNRTCNLKCRSCYNLERSFVKTLDQTKSEIDLLVKKRNLQVITILGGEPTLHPDLIELVRHIKKHKLRCQLLTNGVLLLKDTEDTLLERLINAGIDRILLHIDSGQADFHKDIEEARTRLFSKLERHRIPFSLSLTIYNESHSTLPEQIHKYAHYRYFDGILAVLARDPLPPQTQNADLYTEYQSLQSKLQLEPVSYIPSNLRDQKIMWLIYLYYINTATGQTFSLSPKLYRLSQRIYQRITGRKMFFVKTHPHLMKPALLISLLFESVLYPHKLRTARQLFRKNLKLNHIRFHYIAIQTPPEFNAQKNELELCYHCPDATIRNGKITPVCMADHLSPLNGRKNADIPDSYLSTIYSHLGEY